MNILVLNAGSSSLKADIFDWPNPEPIWQELSDHSGSGTGSNSPGSAGILPASLSSFASNHEIDLVGHRVVHGGARFIEPVRITPEVRRELDSVSELAPEHNPDNLAGIDAALSLLPDIPHIAIFDTAFHNTMPPAAVLYGGPYSWFEELGIRRFGFHGISYQYASARCLQMLPQLVDDYRMVICHLGNGASICAINEGRSVDTTMGYTPMEGLVMGSRSGSIDPGIILHLLKHNKYDPAQLDRILNHESGLKGLSGVSNDLRKIITAMDDEGNERARIAYDVYIHSLCRGIGQMIASLGGIRCLGFTGGVGEHQPVVREDVCERLQFLNISLDDVANYASAPDSIISEPDSALPVVIVKSRENYEIARQSVQFI